jgi:hypothetical protein
VLVPTLTQTSPAGHVVAPHWTGIGCWHLPELTFHCPFMQSANCSMPLALEQAAV